MKLNARVLLMNSPTPSNLLKIREYALASRTEEVLTSIVSSIAPNTLLSALFARKTSIPIG